MKFNLTTTQTNQEKSANSYAEVLNNSPNGLNYSIHTPENRTNKEKAPIDNNTNTQVSTNTINLLKDSAKEITSYIKHIEQKLNNLTMRMDQWKETLDSIDFRFKNIEKHLNITSLPPKIPKIPIIQINTNTSKLTSTIPSKLIPIISTSQMLPQNANNYQNRIPTPVNISSVASVSTTANNNNNKVLTVQSLVNKFNTMQEDISSLKSMLGNLTSMLQNAVEQP